MSIENRKRLEAYLQALNVYEQFRIYPTNQVIIELKQLFADIGHAPVNSNCGGCAEMVLLTLIDHAKEEGLI